MEIIYVSAAILAFWLLWIAVFVKNELKMYHFDKKASNTYSFVVWLYHTFEMETIKWVRD